MDNDLFEHLPLPAVYWVTGHPARLNRAFVRVFGHGPLPAPLLERPDGAHHTRLTTPNGERRVCRMLLRTLPGGERLAVLEDVQAYHTDPLTRLPDRRALLLDAADAPAPATLALLDIDGLAALNRRSGQAAGDQVLCALAGVLAHAARNWPAQVYRLGGDSFVLCSPQRLQPGHLHPLQAAFGGQLATLGVPGRLRRSAFAFALAHAPHDGTTLTDLLGAAERRLGRQRWTRRGGLAAELGHLLRQGRPAQSPAPDPRRTHLVTP
ncbi:diguanylate cyclase [Deinococcus sp. HMF7604]|nr:diguanylate cyclase [Deinococcus betulae]MBZ9750847.1 diguanylate cyclase [Deinococcus betulae]